ncbi:MAG: serine/threonine protein kinase [Gemmataceae bacterium]|nr:serine/threonine protein kinase [Gemmataceae bacterium]
MAEQPERLPTPKDPPATADFSTATPPDAAESARDVTDAHDTRESTTGFVPSFPAPVLGMRPKSRSGAPSLPEPGDRIDDFEIVQVLGAGAFATVFLARQVSLDRQVALKVSANRGSEARTLAQLEHDHIVRVFSEVVLPAKNVRLLCMQFVSGTTLERIIRNLSTRHPGTWSGRSIVEIIDQVSSHPAMFDPAALRDRELLMRSDFFEAACWIVARLAEALAHAHNQRVLHRDIKPANILVNRYGRPMLADFNVALDPQRLKGPAGEVFGGTLGYMAPEHIDAFNPAVNVSPAAVDERSDTYSLGLVLHELLTGVLPFDAVPRTTRDGSSLQLLANQRRAEAPSPRARREEVPEILDRVVRRCLDPDPARRYQTADALGLALKGCIEHRHVEKALPRGGILTRATLRHPVMIGVVLIVLPHILGSAVNISYNSLRIVGNLTEDQQRIFVDVAMAYNVFTYSLCLALIVKIMRPIVRMWQRLSAGEIPGDDEMTAVRHQVLQLPVWAIGLACLGWLPGGILFPLAIDALAGPLDRDVYHHFLVSFTLSGLIAMTYSLFAAQFVVLRVLYPRFWVDGSAMRALARDELQAIDGRLRICQFLAGLIPLAGAALMVSVGPDEQFTMSSYRTFRLLVTALIALGMVGFGAALTASTQLHQILHALVGDERRGLEGDRPSRTSWH